MLKVGDVRMDQLQETLKRFVQDYDIDFFGVADLTSAHQYIAQHNGEHLATFPRAIALGIHLPDAVVDELHRHEDLSALLPYRGLYDSVIDICDGLPLDVAQFRHAGSETLENWL